MYLRSARVDVCLQHLDGNWQSCTLCRSLRQSRGVLEKAARRKVEWPERKEYERSPVEVGVYGRYVTNHMSWMVCHKKRLDDLSLMSFNADFCWLANCNVF